MGDFQKKTMHCIVAWTEPDTEAAALLQLAFGIENGLIFTVSTLVPGLAQTSQVPALFQPARLIFAFQAASA